MKTLTLFVVALMSFALLSFSFAEEAPKETPKDAPKDAPKDPNAVAKEKMKTLIKVSLENTPFADALKVLEEKTGVKITVDPKAAEKAKDVKVTFPFKDNEVKGGMLLTWVVSNANLAYEFKDGGVYVFVGEPKKIPKFGGGMGGGK